MRSYLACTSFVDAQIGRIVSAVEQSDYADNTIIVVWGDHGWHLGDHTLWGKHSNFERSLNSTLIVVDPTKAGRKVDEIAETVDLFPTILKWANIEAATDGTDLNHIMPGKPDGNVSQVYAWRIVNRIIKEFDYL